MKNRSSIIGFALIGIILVLFSWYNTTQFEKQSEEYQRIQDSIALANPPVLDSAAMLAATADSLGTPTVAPEEAPYYQDPALEAAFRGEGEILTLENDKVRVAVTTKGAQPYEVLIKDYFTYDSCALFLIGQDRSSMEIEFNANQWVNTSELNFTVTESSPSHLAMRLSFDEDSYIEAVYDLPEDTYMVDYNLHFVGMDEHLDRRTTSMDLKWVVDMPRLEKGYKNERNYSAVAFRNAGENGTVKTIGQRKEEIHENFSTRLQWVGFQQQFFSAILVADNDFAGGTLVNKFYPETNPDRLLMRSGADLTVEIDSRSADFTVPMHFLFAPNHFPTLKSYDKGFEKIIPLGGKLVGFISRYIIIPTFNWLSKFIKNYGLIILILTLMIKIVISPLTFKSYASSAKMKVIKPEVDKINARYPKQEDAMKKQQATMDLYRKAGISTFGGCLPILLQFPILWAMFRFFPASIELRQQGFLWCHDLSAYDSILDFGFNIPLYGDHMSLFALLMGVSMWLYSRMTMGNMDDSQMPGMKFMNVWMMPIMMVFLCNNFSAGLSYYYMLSNIITIIQNWVIRKFFIDEEKIYANIKAKSAAPAKKSKFQQRLEEMQKAQQQQLKQQNKR
ncbi:MAG: membrane protein insertase YidC [Bacteroidales bacterium]|nr:membrane protein insertase YidC [Bacteroidales bacterium]